MRAVFVNAAEKRLEDIEIEKGLQPLYDMIGCDLVDLVHLGDDDLFVDDEGLLKARPESPFFRIGDVTLAGNGVIVGCDSKTGESCDARHDAAYYKPLVSFTHAAADALRRQLMKALSKDSPF
jgi:hypothetical protein